MATARLYACPVCSCCLFQRPSICSPPRHAPDSSGCVSYGASDLYREAARAEVQYKSVQCDMEGARLRIVPGPPPRGGPGPGPGTGPGTGPGPPAEYRVENFASRAERCPPRSPVTFTLLRRSPRSRGQGPSALKGHNFDRQEFFSKIEGRINKAENSNLNPYPENEVNRKLHHE